MVKHALRVHQQHSNGFWDRVCTTRNFSKEWLIPQPYASGASLSSIAPGKAGMACGGVRLLLWIVTAKQ